MLHRQKSRSFQEVLINFFQPKSLKEKEEIWVLNDINFEIMRGETIGLIGVNGAGKSTLLKLISQIIFPTSGEIEIYGRVGALIELGSGFHPDLSGRENVFLNGAILGLSRAEIEYKLADIIAFAELEDFIDMPVKHYSSGMYIRLGFAVAVHTNPDILIVDEVLAVGDAAFQRKCLDRIDIMRRRGVTILMVSHGLEMVQNMCSRVIWLDKGHIAGIGDTDLISKKYLHYTYEDHTVYTGSASDEAEEMVEEEVNRWGNGDITVEGVRFLGADGVEREFFATTEALTIEIEYHAHKRVKRPVFGLGLHRSDGVHITGPNTQFAEYEIPFLEGSGILRYTIPRLPLLEGTYLLSLAVCDWTTTQMFDYHHQLYPFRVHFGEVKERYGLLLFEGEWQLDQPTRPHHLPEVEGLVAH